MRPFLPLRAVLAVAVMAAVLLPAQQAFAFTDVPSSYWDYSQITYVTPWMSDYGSQSFQPKSLELREFLARSMVQMFAPTATIDSSITFTDLPTTDPFYKYANIATKLNWIPPYPDGTWRPTSSLAKSLFDQALVLALKLQAPVKGLAHIHQANGTAYPVGSRTPFMDLAAWLRLHYNHSDETQDIQARTKMARDEVAYSLWAAKTTPSWELSNASMFDNISLPTLDPTKATQLAQQQVTDYALNQVGYPYIWGGEWNKVSPTGYCCGYQPQGGFDCSGFTWWVLKKYEDGYNSAQYRKYAGWSLHERSSTNMAQMTTTPLTSTQVQIGDLMFFASDGGHSYVDVDHVGIYIGNGWMMHSTDGGPQLETVASGWYHDHFVYGRRLSTTGTVATLAPTNLRAGETAVGPGGR
jgi:cell wall-associated NlpC family hydrolase